MACPGVGESLTAALSAPDLSRISPNRALQVSESDALAQDADQLCAQEQPSALPAELVDFSKQFCQTARPPSSPQMDTLRRRFGLARLVELTIEEGRFAYRRNQAALDAEVALDGLSWSAPPRRPSSRVESLSIYRRVEP